ncbi:hypothetical protein QEG98_41955 (plasmid) [Myxococcus sp. MxC21-1]|uniref:hypothetical protein n=1 Tax=Myxococcus sp. MxC21-1 TaxID=3041439 RepID=UPI00292E21AB|nr:hypothetical protein [Myxococcus sp. MxC21-1]WNZ66234.1 hypothetical protein QEG98_41955 [Myxococcus sp. MxC21-1]
MYLAFWYIRYVETTNLDALVRDLTPSAADALAAALRRLRKELEAGTAHALGAIILRQQTIRCGKQTCPCCPAAALAQGVPVRQHGPYWYAWWWGSSGKKRSAYAGKALRRERVLAQVKVMEGHRIGQGELLELAAVTKMEVAAGWAGEAPGEAARRRLEAIRARGWVTEGPDGLVAPEDAVACLERIEALGFKRKGR